MYSVNGCNQSNMHTEEGRKEPTLDSYVSSPAAVHRFRGWLHLEFLADMGGALEFLEPKQGPVELHSYTLHPTSYPSILRHIVLFCHGVLKKGSAYISNLCQKSRYKCTLI